MSQSMIHVAIRRAREGLAVGVYVEDMLPVIGRLFPWLEARQIVHCAGGFVPGWDAKRGVLKNKKRVGARG